MIVYFSILAILILTNYLILHVKTNRPERQIKVSFAFSAILLSIFSLLRDGIGIDYSAYIRHIGNIQHGFETYMEMGFEELCKFIYRFDTNPRTVIVIIAVLTVFCYLIAIYKLSDDLTLSLFLFLSWGYYFLTFITVRNYFALSLTLLSLVFLKDKKYIPYIILILLAAQFHKSAYICLVVYTLANRKINKQLLIAVSVIVIATAVLFKEQARTIAFYFYPGYENSLYDTGSASILNILKSIIVVALGYIHYPQITENKRDTILYNLNVFGMIVYIGFYWIPEISRIGFYMNATSIALLPNILRTINNEQTRIITRAVLIVGSIILFILLMRGFYSPSTKLLPYETWLKTGY